MRAFYDPFSVVPRRLTCDGFSAGSKFRCPSSQFTRSMFFHPPLFYLPSKKRLPLHFPGLPPTTMQKRVRFSLPRQAGFCGYPQHPYDPQVPSCVCFHCHVLLDCVLCGVCLKQRLNICQEPSFPPPPLFVGRDRRPDLTSAFGFACSTRCLISCSRLGCPVKSRFNFHTSLHVAWRALVTVPSFRFSLVCRILLRASQCFVTPSYTVF